MAVYTTAARIILKAGPLAVELRTDDDDADAILTQCCQTATNQVDWYCEKYSQTELAANGWIQDAATVYATMELCKHRLNPIPGELQKEWDEDYLVKLDAIQKGKAVVPRAATSRNPASVTNYAVDLRRPNNQVRVDRSRSTGQAQDYTRPTDQNAPDQR